MRAVVPKNCTHPECRPRAALGGFTLIELLVVIVIIGILASLLLPALNSAKVRAKTIACIGNVRQLQVCWHMYAQDNDDVIVPNNYVYTVSMGTTNDPTLGEDSITWCRGLAPLDTNAITADSSLLFIYNKSTAIYHCPSDLSTVRGYPAMVRNRSYNVSNSANCSQDPNHFRKYNEIRRPEELFVFIDTHEDDIWDSTFGVISETDLFWSDYWLDIPANRHGQGGNISFADGHVEHWRWRARKLGFMLGQHAYSNDDLLDLQKIQEHVKGASGN
jgi:prepilin-type N-terminal cleavage/methylation domain-containing protein/prepilin-type processing-associated H-X9-DG protein